MSFTFGSPVETLNSGTATITAALTGVPSGAIIIAMYVFNNGLGETFSSLSDNVGGNFTQIGGTINSSSQTFTLGYLPNAASGSHTVSGIASAYGGNYLGVFYVGGAATVDIGKTQDMSFQGTGANAVTYSSGITTTKGNEAVIALYYSVSAAGTLSVGTSPLTWITLGFINNPATSASFGQYYLQTTAGAINPTATTTSSSDILGGVFALTPANTATIAWVT